MNIFQVVKSVLDWEFGRIEAPSQERRIELINERLDELTRAYADLTDENRPRPAYSDAATRLAYVYKYTTCHADMVYSSIRSHDELARLFQGDGWVRITCVGGGPGSDLLGVLKHALLAGTKKSIKCFQLDRQTAWGDTWSDVEQHTDDLPFRLSTDFHALDVTEPSTWSSRTRYLSADLFTFIYFLSEIFRVDAEAREFFRHLVQQAQSGAYFLFIENDAPQFRSQVDRFAQEYGLTVVGSSRERYITDTNEEKKDLKPYYDWLKDSPKIKAYIYKCLMRKP